MPNIPSPRPDSPRPDSPRPDSPRPVAILAPRYPPEIGGVERHVERVAEGLAARGIPVEVIVTDPTGRLPRYEERNGVTIRRFGTLRGDDVFYVSPGMFRWLWRNAGRYRLLHAHNYHGLIPLTAGLAARHHGLPLVVTPHYHATGHTRFRSLLHVAYRPFGRWAMRSAARVSANSAAEAGWIQRDFDIVATVVPNGVDVPKPAPIPADRTPGATQGLEADGTVSILSVGRLVDYKQVGRIVTALPHLPAEYVLTVVGQGPSTAAIHADSARLGVADRVRLLGHVPAEELARRYARADAFVTMSREESFGLTVLEAAAAGAPVLASDIPAHREVTGYTAPGRITLIDPDADGERISEAIRETVERGRSNDRSGGNLPTWEGTVEGMIEIYEALLGTPLARLSAPLD